MRDDRGSCSAAVLSWGGDAWLPVGWLAQPAPVAATMPAGRPAGWSARRTTLRHFEHITIAMVATIIVSAPAWCQRYVVSIRSAGVPAQVSLLSRHLSPHRAIWFVNDRRRLWSFACRGTPSVSVCRFGCR